MIFILMLVYTSKQSLSKHTAIIVTTHSEFKLHIILYKTRIGRKRRIELGILVVTGTGSFIYMLHMMA